MYRRRLLSAGLQAGAGIAISGLVPAWARSGSPGLIPQMPALSGEDISLKVGHSRFTVNGKTGHAISINGTIPAPLIRLREGQNVRIAVTNTLNEDTSIHWHGLLVPFDMDGVPGVSFPGIRPGETFVYEFPVRHAGTFWYHSHSNLQEQLGHYGPLILDPPGTDPVQYDREHVVVLSDWSFMHPHKIMQKLKQDPGYFNGQKQTLAGLIGRSGVEEEMSIADRLMWQRMRMDPTDIADVTGSTYTYLVNGHGPAENWTALFRPNERVRLRVINASAMTVFNVRIPDLPMTVVNADGNDVRPVEVDEFQISVAETYDVVVQSTEDRAFTLVAESVDRSGLARATLAPRPGMSAAVPPLRPRPTLGMEAMGMAMHHDSTEESGDHGRHQAAAAPAPKISVGPGVDMVAMHPQDAASKRGLGLEDQSHRVLVYADLVALEANPDRRPPSRSLEIHLTGNMERFMWSFDGKKFSEVVQPIRFARDERVRVTLVNNTMMQHPIHLHGHFFEIVNGHPGHHPMKHTVNVLPGSKITFDLTADNPGDWAFHCHLLYHMHAGMFNVVTVRPMEEDAP
jgi:FtsP/CotA-like multicopper oxidase with cupredoxin domain